ncbi:hypothetical protein QQM79_12375 [Marinobacteraceae bacterium S3BR75-40.1]
MIRVQQFFPVVQWIFILALVSYMPPLSAKQNTTNLQRSLDSLSGRVINHTYISPSGLQSCQIPERVFEDPENNFLGDHYSQYYESLSLHTKMASATVDNLFLIENVSRARVGHGAIAQVHPEKSIDEQLREIVQRIQTSFLEEGLALNQKVVREEAIQLHGLPARLLVAEVSLSAEDHQRYGHLVTIAGGNVFTLDYMPLLVPKNVEMVSVKTIQDSLLELASGCHFKGGPTPGSESSTLI